MKLNHLHILLLIVAFSAWSCQKDLLEESEVRPAEPTYGSMTRSYPATTGNKWAIIINGGGDPLSNRIRYWNDCSFFYSTLKSVYNIPDSQIYVAMSDGTSSGLDRINNYGVLENSPLDLDGDGINDIYYPGTKNGILSAFADASNDVKSGDEVIIFVTDHGTKDTAGNYYLNLWNNQSMTATEFKSALSSLPSEATKHIIMGQCFSGGFISGLQGVKQMTISTACSSSEVSYPTSDYLYDEFLYHWTAAIAGQYPGGTSANADTNNDGIITIREAFNYAQTNDTMTETPQFYEYKYPFGNIPFCYQYKYIEPYITGPTDLNRGGTYTFHIVNYNPDINPATLVSTSDFTLVSSTDSTIVVSVNSTGGPKYGSVSFGLSSSNVNYLNSTCYVDDVVIWQTGTFPDSMGAIEASYSSPNCDVHLLPRFSLVSNGFYWNTNDSNWSILRRRIPDALFRFEGGLGNEPNELALSIDITNPFGNTTTLTKTIDLTE